MRVCVVSPAPALPRPRAARLARGERRRWSGVELGACHRKPTREAWNLFLSGRIRRHGKAKTTFQSKRARFPIARAGGGLEQKRNKKDSRTHAPILFVGPCCPHPSASLTPAISRVPVERERARVKPRRNFGDGLGLIVTPSPLPAAENRGCCPESLADKPCKRAQTKARARHPSPLRARLHPAGAATRRTSIFFIQTTAESL